MNPQRKLQVGDVLVIKKDCMVSDRVPISGKILVEVLTVTQATLNYFGNSFIVKRSTLGHELKWGRIIKLLNENM